MERTDLEYDGNNILSTHAKISLQNALIDFSNKSNQSGYENLLLLNAKTKAGKLRRKYEGSYDFGNLVLISDMNKIFAGIFEIIYQVRCHLVHGSLKPIPENHEVVKYCYLILWDCLKGFCE